MLKYSRDLHAADSGIQKNRTLNTQTCVPRKSCPLCDVDLHVHSRQRTLELKVSVAVKSTHRNQKMCTSFKVEARHAVGPAAVTKICHQLLGELTARLLKSWQLRVCQQLLQYGQV